MKTFLVTILTILFLIGTGIGLYLFVNRPDTNENTTNQPPEVVTPTEPEPTESEVDESRTVIGQSIDGTDITAYHYGLGDEEVLFVGGIHGGYSWNTVLVSYELMDYLEENEAEIPENLRVTVIPVLNPDGLERVVASSTARFTANDVSNNENETIAGRFNARNVDLNRNFDCDWSRTATWQQRSVNPGTAAFSEPESQAFRNYIQARNPEAVVVWYSAVGGVFASSCHNGVLDETKTLTDLYSEASGYRAYQEFNFYEITGDMVNWLAKINIPAISVLLTNHEDVEWDRNQRGIEAILNHYAR